MKPALMTALLLSGLPNFAAASTFERENDTRTVVPELVARGGRIWGTDLDAGATLTRGNVVQTSVTGGFAAFRRSGDWTAYLLGGATFVAYDNHRLQNRGSGTLRADYRLSDRWRLFAYSTNAYNQFLLIGYRGTYGAGPWYDFTLGPVRNGLSLALAYEFTRFSNNQIDRTARTSVRWLASLALSDTADTGFDFFYVPAPDNFPDYRIYFSPFLESKVWKDTVGLKLAYRFEYDNRPRQLLKSTDSELLASFTLHLGAAEHP